MNKVILKETNTEINPAYLIEPDPDIDPEEITVGVKPLTEADKEVLRKNAEYLKTGKYPGDSANQNCHLDSEEIRNRSFLSAAKVEEFGIKSLTEQEKADYAYCLICHINKTDAKGNPTKPIHINVADLVLLNLYLFVHNQDVYIYNSDNGTYEKDDEGKRIKKAIKDYLDREFREDKIINNVYSLIVNDATLSLSENQINNRPKTWIHFKNGYFDPVSKSWFEHNPKYHEIGVIPYEYSPSRYPGNFKFKVIGDGILRETIEEPLFFDSWIEDAIPDPYDRYMLYQDIAYTMTLDTSKQKFMMICGPGGTGKSTLLSLIEAIIGKSNISHISLQGLQDRFAPGELYLKQANICADIPLSALSEVDMIKKLTGEDTISADRKFKSNFSFRSYARLFFSANDIPINLSDHSNAFYRRMLILKMDQQPKRVDQNLLGKLKAEIPNIITRCVEEYECSMCSIDESHNSIMHVKNAYKNSDTVEAFLDDRCVSDSHYRTPKTKLYIEYCNYCDNEGRKSLTRNKFYKSIEAKGFRIMTGGNREVIGLGISNIVPLPEVAYSSN